MSKNTKEAKERKENLNSKTSKTKSVEKQIKKTTTTTPKKNSTVTQKSTTNSKKASSKKEASKKSPSKKTTTKKVKPIKTDILEYYDLPYRYNKTIVKILAQTPKTLFVYWDISDEDRANYIKQYGENFFNDTTPVLIINNTTMNYTFEIEINDFANCWYFNINDEKCEYTVELGRRPKKENIIPNNYLCITSSNKIESPNGHILFEKQQNSIFYRNVKTNETYSKDIANLQFIKHFGKIYNAFDIYQKIYKEENILDINNPSSSFK